MIQKILLFILSFLAKKVIQKHKPYVIWITGTAWKTTVSWFVYQFLSFHFWKDLVYISPYSYNGEYGLPLTLLQQKSPWKNLFWWIVVFISWMRLLYKKYPKYIILEYWIDHPGEMDFLLNIIEPEIAILTNISPNHLLQFGTFEKYALEKEKILSRSLYQIVHESISPKVSPKWALRYWFSIENHISLSDVKSTLEGIHFSATIEGKIAEFSVPIFWSYQAENILPVLWVASILWIPLDDCIRACEYFMVEKGRWKILSWMYDSRIIDGSYNGWYLPITKWIEEVTKIQWDENIILFLWDMRELGDLTESVHRDLLNYILTSHKHIHQFYSIILVGENMGKYVFPYLKDIQSCDIRHFNNSKIAGLYILWRIKESKNRCVIYVKWSQNTIFLEEGIKEFLLNKNDINMLCRQSESWIHKKDKYFNNLISNLVNQ